MMMMNGICMGEMRNAYTILVVKPPWRKPLEGIWHRWKDNIIINLKAVIYEGVV
jgi:hypothetical protein